MGRCFSGSQLRGGGITKVVNINLLKTAFTYINAHRKTPLETHFMYLATKKFTAF
jgi:hypothetical protein